MQNVILVVHILACVVMTAVILLQKSEGGALGIGGGGGGLMTSRGAAGALVRTTMFFGGIFFLTSLGLTTLANRTSDTRSELERVIEEETPDISTDPADIFDPSTPLLEQPVRDEQPVGSVLDAPVESPEPTDPPATEEEAVDNPGQ
ncbi:MAG: preprotein translocase subunit SecG [Pseudomonadota bacterium]